MTTPHSFPEKSSLGIDANLVAVLTYVAGFISGIAFLVLEKESKLVRFHAMQSTIVFAGIAVFSVIINLIPVLGALITIFLLWPAMVALWLVLMFKAYRGEKFKLPVIGDIAEQQVQ
jgi:uncharacterized membrane protein